MMRSIDLTALVVCSVLASAVTLRAQEAVAPAADAVQAGSLEEARLLFEQGIAHVEASEWALAEQSFRRVLAIRSSPVVAYNLASALAQLGRLIESAELLRVVVRDPAVDAATRDPAQQLLAEIEPRICSLTVRVQGDTAGARRQLERALSALQSPRPVLHATVAEILELLGELDATEGELEAARARYEQALAIRRQLSEPSSTEVMQTTASLAQVLAKLGMPEDAARRLGRQRRVDVRTTLLGAHALPPEYEGRQGDYTALVADTMIPRAAKEGLADAVDAFCEKIAFTPKETESVFDGAGRHGLAVKLHADQLSDLGGAALEAVALARRVGLGRRLLVEQAAEVDELLLRCLPLAESRALPLGDELLRRHRPVPPASCRTAGRSEIPSMEYSTRPLDVTALVAKLFYISDGRLSTGNLGGMVFDIVDKSATDRRREAAGRGPAARCRWNA